MDRTIASPRPLRPWARLYAVDICRGGRTGWLAAGTAAALLVAGLAALSQAASQAEDGRRTAAAREALDNIEWPADQAEYLGQIWLAMKRPMQMQECQDPGSSLLMRSVGREVATGFGTSVVVTEQDVRAYLAGVCD